MSGPKRRSRSGSTTASRASGSSASASIVRPNPWTIAETPEHAGCKTWVPLDSPLSTAGLAAVLDPTEHAGRLGRLRDAIAPAFHRDLE